MTKIDIYHKSCLKVIYKFWNFKKNLIKSLNATYIILGVTYIFDFYPYIILYVCNGVVGLYNYFKYYITFV